MLQTFDLKVQAYKQFTTLRSLHFCIIAFFGNYFLSTFTLFAEIPTASIPQTSDSCIPPLLLLLSPLIRSEVQPFPIFSQCSLGRICLLLSKFACRFGCLVVLPRPTPSFVLSCSQCPILSVLLDDWLVIDMDYQYWQCNISVPWLLNT